MNMDDVDDNNNKMMEDDDSMKVRTMDIPVWLSTSDVTSKLLYYTIEGCVSLLAR